jgi:hypothetical protein
MIAGAQLSVIAWPELREVKKVTQRIARRVAIAHREMGFMKWLL